MEVWSLFKLKAVYFRKRHQPPTFSILLLVFLLFYLEHLTLLTALLVQPLKATDAAEKDKVCKTIFSAITAKGGKLRNTSSCYMSPCRGDPVYSGDPVKKTILSSLPPHFEDNPPTATVIFSIQ